MSVRWVDEDEVIDIWPYVIAILKLIGTVLWTTLRIMIIVFLALVLGGFRGAAVSRKQPSS